MKVVKYMAGWCAPCASYAPVFEQAQNQLGFQYPKITWESRNVDAINPADYGVSSLPTTITYNDDGTEIARLVGNLPLETLAQLIMDSYSKASEKVAATNTEPER